MEDYKELKEIVPYLILDKGNIIEVSKLFTDFTGYNEQELLEKSHKKLFDLLKINYISDPLNKDEEYECYLFTKTFEVREVVISYYETGKTDKKICFIKEKEHSRLEEVFPYMHQLCVFDIEGVAVHSVPELTLLKANSTYLKFLDPPYNKIENSIGKKQCDIITGYKDSNVEALWNSVVKSEKPAYINEFRYDNFQRGVTYWDISLIPVKITGRVKYIVETSRDITEAVLNRKTIEEQAKIIEQKNNQLEAILENMTDAMIVYDKANQVVLTNTAAKNVFYEFDKYRKIGDSLSSMKYFDGEGKEYFLETLPINRTLRGEKLHNDILIAKRPDKTLHYRISSSPIYDEYGKVEYAVLCMNEITDMMERERAITEQKDELEAIINNMSDGLSIFDEDGKYVLFNKAAQEMFFPSYEYMTKAGDGFYQAQYFDEEGNVIPFERIPANRVKNGEKFTSMYMKAKFPDKILHLNVSGAPVFNSNNKLVMGIICSQDISRKVEYEERLRNQNELLEKAMEMKDEFLSLISHELRTPLNVINTAIQAMEIVCKNNLPEKAKGYIKMIRQNMYRQLRLVNNLLDITRANAGRISVHKKNLDIVLLSKAITESVNNYAAHKHIKLSFKSNIEERVIGIDDEKYERILLNLLSNAIKFTPEGKTIRVEVGKIKGYVKINVSDTGIGIPKEKIGIIFERFGQVESVLSRQAEGAGIGLSLVKKLVEAMDGSISVKSTPGKGTTFSILLPDKKTQEDNSERPMISLMNNRLIEITCVEFSDIYM